MTTTVEFENIRTSFTTEKPIQISFKILDTISQVNPDDWIYLLPEGATSFAQVLLSVKVGHPSGYWPVDDSSFKVGGVMLDLSEAKLPPVNKSGEAVCCLWFVRKSVTSDDQVLTKTKSFIVQFKEGVDYTWKSLVDDFTMITVNKSEKCFSQPSQVESLDRFSSYQSDSADQPSSSFVIVNDVNSHISSVSETENGHDPSLSEHGEVDVVPIASKQGTSEDNPLPVPLESEPWTQKTNNSEPSKFISESERPIPKCRSKIKDKATNTEVTKETNEVGVQVDSPEHLSPVIDQSLNRIADVDFELVQLPESTLFPVDMSASVNLDTALVSQREAKMLKNANKEQRLKIKMLISLIEKSKQENAVLTEEKDKLKQENAVLTEDKDKLKQNIAMLREDRKDVDVRLVRDLKKQLQQLHDERESIVYHATREKKVMEKKVTQLQLDSSTLFERCTSLLLQLQEQETDNTILTSENLALSEKVKGLEEKMKKLQQQSQPREKVEKPKRSFHVPQVQSNAKNLEDAITAATRPVKKPLPTIEKIPQRKRPSDLPLDVIAKTKPAPVPLDVIAKTKPAPVPLDMIAKTKPAPVPLDVIAKTKPAPVPLDMIAKTKPAPVPLDVIAKTKPAPVPLDVVAKTKPAPVPLDSHYESKPLPVPRKNNPHKGRSTWRSTDAGSQASKATYSKRPQHHDSRKLIEEVSKVKSVWNASGETKSADVKMFSSTSKADEILSEDRIEEIASQLRGTPVVMCPVCQKVLHARDGDFAVRLHVEHCLQGYSMI